MSISSDAARTVERLDIGRVLSLSMGLIGRNAATLGALAAIFSLLPDLVFGAITTWVQPIDPNDAMATFRGAPGQNLVNAILGIFLTAGIAQTTVSDLAGRQL